MKDNPSRVDLNMLHVTADRFYFTAVPKHCDGDMECSTEWVGIDSLETSELLVKL
jgi:hypothetical protein